MFFPTPEELKVLVHNHEDDVKDHGMKWDGFPSLRVSHAISIRESRFLSEAIEYLESAEYKFSLIWTDSRGSKFSIFEKEYPLSSLIGFNPAKDNNPLIVLASNLEAQAIDIIGEKLSLIAFSHDDNDGRKFIFACWLFKDKLHRMLTKEAISTIESAVKYQPDIDSAVAAILRRFML